MCVRASPHIRYKSRLPGPGPGSLLVQADKAGRVATWQDAARSGEIFGAGAETILAAIALVSEKLAALGSSAKRIEIQSEFLTQLVDILKEGVGNLVDADLANESARLQALQIKQQLGVQALAIANASPQNILALFQ